MITQKEALKAMLDGKTIETQDHYYKLEGDSIMFFYKNNPAWKQLTWLSNAVEIVEETYTLTFSEAYLKMKMGAKAVRKGESDVYYFISDQPQGIGMGRRIYFRPVDNSEPKRLAYININALEDKWRVVE